MSVKSKVLAAVTAFALCGAGAGLAGTSTAHAATPPCGTFCADIFSDQFGDFTHPNFTLDVQQQAQKVGQKIILFRTSNSDPAEDFNAEFDGFVSDFYAAGLVSSAVRLHYGGGAAGYPNDAAGEIEYAPYGVASGLCVGLASTAFQGEGVTLQPCGVTARTVWIVDTGDQATITSAGVPLVNGSDTNFSHPYVLSYPRGGHPADKPRPQLTVKNLTGFSGSFLIPILGTVDSNQRWSAVTGVLP